ncbi:DUF2599 domain-containing protein [Nocardia sp. NBC_01730]|uniref:DUF2599 domain-containing protein n=1 Tax=Nocardia sp. NBC_01730 TaxID=2975998 RepID=UPI002E0D205A|nr:DUF2599 domain-containing protein [Nocardia sp. NBC_01730]
MAQRYPHRDGVRFHAAALLSVALLPMTVTACGSEESASAPGSTTTTSPVTTTPTRSAPATPVSTPLGAVPTVDPYPGMPLIDHVTWTEAVDGPRLLVFPTSAGRQTTFPGSDERAWQEVIAQSSDADTPGMRDQFTCHWDWARLVQPNKPSWNLEPWRPVVGYSATVDARCNPGGPER